MERKKLMCKNLYCQAYPDCCTFIQCCDLPCSVSSLHIIGQTVPQSNEPITSSNASSRYTRPAEIIQEEININQLQLSDTTLQCAPLHLRQLFHLYNVNILSSAHVMFLLVNLVAIECGFISKQHFMRLCRVLYPTKSIFTYHSKNVLFLSRQKPIYKFDGPHETYFSTELRVLNRNLKNNALYSVLTAIVSGDCLIVTLTPAPKNLNGFSSCLSISRYILSKLSSRKPLGQYFRRLDQLTMQLREDIFIPVRNEQLEYITESLHPSIFGLPYKIRELVYDYLKENDFKNLAQVSKKFNGEVEERRISFAENHDEFTELQISEEGWEEIYNSNF